MNNYKEGQSGPKSRTGQQKDRRTSHETDLSSLPDYFVFYDTETSGLSKAFDQIVQIAAVRTDADLMQLWCDAHEK
jgi:DNA polymerase III epsilon subunit-like protein